ncbi:hypothetical protein JCM11641_000824 [Rhodosporidiobolus odoratus]
MSTQLAIPGYTYDPVKKRYFKAPPTATKQTPTSQSRVPALSSTSTSSNQPRTDSDGRKRKRARRAQVNTKQKALPLPQPNLWGLRDFMLGGGWDGSVGKREALHHNFRSMSLTRSHSAKNLYPDCLPLDDEITHLSFSAMDPAILQLGGSNGIIATGNLARKADESTYFPNDEEGWRTSWCFSSKITSLKTCGERVLATSLGPPAQALVGTTTDSISLASVTLSPRKTSLWSSALSSDLVALGCDKKVLVTSDPSRPGGQMDGYSTGGNRGDGTVFALELLIFAGTRKGRVQLFDRRSTRPTPSSTSASSARIAKDELNISLSSPITHLRHIKEQPYLLLAAGMDGFIGLYDLRFPPRPSPRSSSPSTLADQPLLSLSGHVNSFSQNLGLDVWKDEFVVAAGQDSRLRLWSFRTGHLLSPPPLPSLASSSTSSFSSSSTSATFSPATLSALSSFRTYTPSPSLLLSSISTPAPTPTPPPNPFHRTYSAPLKAVCFSSLDPVRLGEGGKKRYAESLVGRSREVLEREGREDGEGRWGVPSLWVAEGGGVEGFGAA